MSTAAAILPTTEEAVEYLADLRRELRFDERFDAAITAPLRFAVRGLTAPKSQPNPSPGTACWSFRGTPGAHMIHFCLTMLEKMLPGCDWRGYITAYAHHEFMHAVETKRVMDEYMAKRGLKKSSNLLKAAADRLKKEGVPFSEWNLFEDARIEFRGRGDFSFPMKWLDYEELKPADKARGYLFNLIQNEGRHSDDLIEEELRSEAWVARVRDYYYPRATKADDFEVMVKLLKEWVAEFPQPESPGGGGKGMSLSDLAAALGMSDEDFKSLVSIAMEQAGEQEDDDAKDCKGQGEPDGTVLVPDASNDPIIRDGQINTLDLDLAKRVEDRLTSLLAPGHSRERTVHASKRISVRAYAMGRPDFFRRKNPDRKGRPVKTVYMIDCSGSIRSVISGGLAIAMGLNNLARRGLVTGHIVLHKGSGKRALCATYELPLPDNFFERIPTDGGYEAIFPAMQKCLKILREADYVFCYTDGQICDAPIDKVWLARHGLRPIGLYCGDEDMAETLKTWFACALIRPTVIELLEAIVATVDFKSFTRR